MRVLIFVLLPILFVGLIAFLILGLKPPSSIRLAAGVNGGGYWQIGQLYKAELARDDIQIDLVETAGSVENIEKLVSGEVDVAFVQGGLDLPQESGLQSLGAIFLEPMVVFQGKPGPIGGNAGEWDGIRLAAGTEGSGTRAAAIALIEAAGHKDTGITLVDAGGLDAIDALYTGKADAALFVAPLDAPYLMDAIFDPNIEFVPMTLVDALALKLEGASSVTVPAGSITLDPPRPPEDVKILALRASMIGGPDLHPAVADRLVAAAKIIHGQPGILQGASEYPKTESPPAPLNKVAEELINTGPNFLHAVLPYWIAAQFGRVLLLLLPLLFLAPLLRIVPSGYVWFQKRRVWRFYQRIAALEEELAQARTQSDLDAVAKSIEELDANIANLNLPLAYRQGAYDARLHIGLIRQEITRRSAAEQESDPVARSESP
ncbi:MULTISPECIES: TAXI family TRAP transporter solute-binding subunit [unclassified Ruegeria]|uniref:TAXI family TRAP transporter solute-binding subunit n=1 Tax=unclassified Ruegeria TaxID=2625375 RepID=UPI001AE2D955|nr:MULTISPECIES: TAXI family TRAP transporter solute-binding subunit [unclassified Ruegeria]